MRGDGCLWAASIFDAKIGGCNNDCSTCDSPLPRVFAGVTSESNGRSEGAAAGCTDD